MEDTLGRRRAPEHLSRATREQLYLALRFGLVREFGQREEPLPVIVDEVLVNFDPQRARAAAEAFAQLAHETQVMVFTCHPWIAELFCSVAPNAQLIELDIDASLTAS